MNCKRRNSSIFVAYILVLTAANVSCSLSDETTNVFGRDPVLGVISAFGDIDANKATDVFVLSEDGKSVFILEAEFDTKRDEAKLNKRAFINGKAGDAVITSVVPGDFNSDSQMDALLTRRASTDKNSKEVKVEIYSGKEDTPELPYLTMNETFLDQPVVVDWNGDMVPDLFGETSDGKRAVWIFMKNGSYIFQLVKNGTAGENLPPLKIPQSSAFLDLNDDLTADLCVVSLVNNLVSFEFWLNVGGDLTWVKTIPAPSELKKVGQASFVDMSGDHGVNIVLPGCLDDDCKKGAIFVWSHQKYTDKTGMGKWHKLEVNFEASEDRVTSFMETVTPKTALTIPIALRMGDFNRDGYPDAIAILSDTQEGTTNSSCFLLYNKGCGSGCEGFSRTLTIDYGQPLHKHKPVIASFFDLMENGVLDILLTEAQDDGKAVVRAIEQDFSGDANFLKVIVVSGLCYENCPNGHSPYGVNQVGPTAKFESTTPSGGDQIGIASQLTQSAYFSLQLPFMLFGLGQTPNFVDDLEVGIPYPSGASPRHHTWSTIIPNSQIIVIPYPIDSPGSWEYKLYITPSRLVLLTGVSLLGTCAFIAVIVGLLHWRERREDKREKLQESQRFHFDAM